jgi:hypothetical protein
MYGSIAEADAYFEYNDFDETWANYTNSQKTKALTRATVLIDRLPLVGRRYEHDQANEFPRIKCWGFRTDYFDLATSGGVVIPDEVKEACYIQAKWLLDTANNCTIKALEMGITSISAGKTSQTIDMLYAPMNLTYGLCREAMELMKRFMITSI